MNVNKIIFIVVFEKLISFVFLWFFLIFKLYVFCLVFMLVWDIDNKKNNSVEVIIVVVCNVSKLMYEIIVSNFEIWRVNFVFLFVIFF